MTEKKLAYIFFRENNIVVENDRAVISCHLQKPPHLFFFYFAVFMLHSPFSSIFIFNRNNSFKKNHKGEKKEKCKNTHQYH